jgi:signal transduction histidine kinase/CheY-like chemotaxis protein
MRLTSAATAVVLLVMLLTWFLLRGMNLDSQLSDRALTELDDFAMVEAALQRDVLTARAGMLRYYDPIVRKETVLNDALGRLQNVAAVYADSATLTRGLTGSIARQEELIEQFKSDNALLQNSLAYFALLSARLCASHKNELLAPAISALAASVLHLTLDTSPATAREVEGRLDKLSGQASQSGDAELIDALLAHGGMLHALLPATDDVLKALFALPIGREQTAIRSIVVAHHSAAQETARRFRVLLDAASVLLLGLLVQLGLRLRARTRALRRRAAFEHVIASVSMRFVLAPAPDTTTLIEQALAQMAECVGADRAYFIAAGPARQVYTWCRPGVTFPPGWPHRALTLKAKFSPIEERIVHIPDVNRLPLGNIRDLCIAVGLRGWACVSNGYRNGLVGVLGFDALHQPCRITRAGELGLLRMALDILANAVEREGLERERGRLETQLQHAHRMETVGALTSGIAHNFNNIVGAILGYAEMAEAQLTSKTLLSRNLGEIRRAGERARDLADHILAFGHRRDARRSPVKVQTLLAETASLLHASLPAQIALVSGEAPEAALVSGELAQLQQVVINLCKNAAQAMSDKGRIEIETDIREVPEGCSLTHGELCGGRYVRISVSDTGRGMDEATLGRIFEPFFTTRLAGNGLGLATVREIVREHSGAINVWSAPGVGTRFEVWLPSIGATDLAPREIAPALPLGRGETVLLVEHDRERLLGAEEMLAALGYEPVGFARGDEALASCWSEPQRFNALVIGHLVPTRAALELAAALHEVMPNVPILLATGSADEIGATALMAAGVSEIVSRPLIATEIAATLARCLAVPGHVAARVFVDARA